MSPAPSEKDPSLSHAVLEGLCLSLTQAMKEFLQAHTATIDAYTAQWEGSNGPRFDVAHRTLTQEIEHVERFVGILQTDLARILKELPQPDTEQLLSSL
jgi:hypothetical protein